MSGKAMKWARGQQFGTSALKSLVNAIAARADDQGLTWVSQATLASDIGASERHVRALLSILDDFGAIERRPRSSGRNGRLSDYTTLAVDKNFTVGKRLAQLAISQAKGRSQQVPSGTRGPVGKSASESSNRNTRAVATGTRGPGNNKGTTYPSQGGKISEYQNVALPPEAPRLMVVGGRALAGGGGR